ncbi:MAG: two-component system cell cycle sensor histidine kinase/response regulator CckA [Myxococcota bacterium]|jgi:two-component system cell cycle sensor histidine kinase/response regulator CckA
MLDPGALACTLVGLSRSQEVADAVLDAVVEAGATDAALFRFDVARGVMVRMGARGRIESIPQSTPASGERSWPGAGWASFALGRSIVAYLFVRGRVAMNGPWLAMAGRALGAALDADAARWDAALLEQVLRHVRDGVLFVTMDGEVRRYGAGVQAMVGWTAEEVAKNGWTNLVYPDVADREAARSAIQALTLGRPSEGTVRTLRRSDGTSVRAAVWSAVVPDPRGGASGLLGVLHDVTDAGEQRQRAVREESLDHLGRLAARIAHDFNNLLGAILGSAELIELQVAADPALSGVSGRARIIADAAEAGAHLARQLLVLGGLSSATTEPIALGGVIERTLAILKDGLGGTSVVRDLQEHLPHVAADGTQLMQVVLNLVTNAVEAAPAGRVWVSASVDPMPASPSYRALHAPPSGTPMVVIEVADDGAGFGADSLDRALEPFFSTKAEGHGVGLAAVRAIVAAHGAALDLGNRPEGGAVVRCWWRIDDRPEAALPALSARAPASGRSVWVVDDNVQVLEFSRISLGHRGYAVRSFSRHADAVAAAESGDTPDVVVLDVVMPEGPGRARLQVLRAMGITAPVVWTSGHTPASAGLDLREHEGFVQKPYTGDALANAVAAQHGP